MSDQDTQTALTAVEAQVAEDVAPICHNEPSGLTLIDAAAQFSKGTGALASHGADATSIGHVRGRRT
jgi:hypothetical protein